VELKHLRYFVAVATDENISRAAEKIRIAAPALSRRIRDLELELGFTLFERRKKRIYLTDAGKIFLAEAQRLLESLEAGVAKARKVAMGHSGRLSLGLHAAAMRHAIVSTAFSTFLLQYKEAELKLETMWPLNLADALESGQLDAALMHRSNRQERPGLDWLEVAVDRFAVALPAAHPLARRPSLRLHDLAEENFVWMPRSASPVMNDRLLAACRAGGLNPRISQHIAHEANRLEIIADAGGAAFVLANVWNPFGQKVVIRPVDDLEIDFPLDLVWRRGDIPPLVDMLISTFRSMLAQGLDASA